MDEIRPGVFHWKAFHEGIRTQVSSYYLAEPATLIDPMLPDDGVKWFDEHSAPERIVLTNRHHYRHSAAFSEAFACPVLCHEAGLHEFGPDQPVRGFAFGDELAPGVTAVEIGAICPEETALHIALGDRMIAFADALIRYEEMPRSPTAIRCSARAARRSSPWLASEHRSPTLSSPRPRSPAFCSASSAARWSPRRCRAWKTLGAGGARCPRGRPPGRRPAATARARCCRGS
jgi:hypothetical protein